MQESRYTVKETERRVRDRALSRLGYNSYHAYLNSEWWRSVRERYYSSDRPQKCICGETEGLNLHHLTYARIGEELLEDLRALCSGCHTMLHILERRGDASLDPSTITDGIFERQTRDFVAEATEMLNATKDLSVSEAIPRLIEIGGKFESREVVEVRVRHMAGLSQRIRRNGVNDKSRRRLKRMLIREIDWIRTCILEKAEFMAAREARRYDAKPRRNRRVPVVEADGTVSGRWAGWRTTIDAAPVSVSKLNS